MTTSGSIDLTGCARRIGDAVNIVFASLAELEAEAQACWARAQARHKEVSKADLAGLQPMINELLAAPERRFYGTGVVIAPGALADAQLHLEWWQRGADDRPYRLQLNLNPHSDGFYDYRSIPWFAIPRDEGRGTVMGPYVDLNGSDLYVLTFTRPLVMGGEFVGVVGADVPLGSFERLLLRPLKNVPGDAVVVTSEGRVLASNTPVWTPGSLVRDLLRDGSTAVRASVEAPAVDWIVIGVGE